MKAPDIRPKSALGIYIALVSSYRLFLIGGIPLSPDEAYYWTWSRRLSVCYYDQPGMVAWIDRLFSLPWERTTAFSLRLGAVVLSALSIWLLYRAYLEYREREGEAFLFAAIFSLLPFSWLAGILMIHDTTLLPWMAFAMWMLVRLVKRGGRAVDWLLFSLGLIGAMYAKFSAAMISWGLLLYMLWSPKGRRWWLTWPPYAAGLLAAILYAPVILWNAQHDFISLAAVRELTDMDPLSISRRLHYMTTYVLSQVGLFAVVLGAISFWALFRGLRDAIRNPEDDESLLPVCLALPVFAYFFVQSFKSHVFGNWPGPAYIPLAMIGMKAAADLWEKSAFLRRLAIAGVALDLVLVATATLHLRHDLFRPLLGAIEERQGLKDRIDWRVDQDFRGWDFMTRVVEDARPGSDFILARNYQIASMLEIMLPDQPMVECYNEGRRGNQWDLWSRLTKLQGRNALYVDVKKMPEVVKEKCGEVEVVAAPVVLGDPERPVKKFYIYRCRGWKGPD